MGQKIFDQPDSLASNNITVTVFWLDWSGADTSSGKKYQPDNASYVFLFYFYFLPLCSGFS